MRRTIRRPVRRTTRSTARRIVRRTRRRVIRRTILVGGMVVIAAQGRANAIKLSQQDAKRIEQHTGLPAQELEDQDLQSAMQELSIQPQPLTPEDRATLNQPADRPQSTQPASTESPQNQQDFHSDLVKLAELRDKGILTEEEFEAKKRKILGL